MPSRLTAVIACILSLAVTVQPALAGGCHHFFRQQVVHRAVYVQKAVPYYAQQTLYLAGGDLINKATMRQVLREEFPAMLAQAQLQANNQGSQQHSPGHAAPAQTQRTATTSVLNTRCASCHANANSSYGAYFDLSAPLDPKVGLQIADWIANPDNPKTPIPAKMVAVIKNIPNQEKGSALQEIINRALTGQVATVAPPPEPTPAPPLTAGF